MTKKILPVVSLLGIFAIILCTSKQNPYTIPGNARISLLLMNSSNLQGVDLAVSDTVGHTVKVGVCPFLSDYIDSAWVSMLKFSNGNDSVIVIKKFLSDADTQWFDFTFSSAKKCSVSVKAFIQGGTQYAVNGLITIFGKPVSGSISPANDTLPVDSLILFAVQGTGDAPFAYQWFHDTTLLSGKTGFSLAMSHLTFADSGTYSCLVTDKWGDTATSNAARLFVVPKPVVKVNTKPVLVVTGRKNILSTEICTLTVTATDPDSGQTDLITLVSGPAGNTFSNNKMIWKPTAGFLGADTAVFAVVDNGVPPLSDTQKVAIVVSATILPPDSVKGIVAVSRFAGVFVFKWNKVANADAYIVFRSKDTSGFAPIDTLSDSTLTNAIKDTAFYYYVVATNSKGASAPSLRIRSTAVNAPPKWSHDSISVSVNEGASVSFNCADSCKDTNGDAVVFSLASAGSVNDSIIGTIWRFSPTYTDAGSYTVKIKAWDGIDSSVLTIALHVVNVPRPPQPQPQSLSTNRNTPLQITLSALDPDGDAITSWVIDTPTTHGTVSLASSSQPAATYTPATGYMGTDYFTFKASVGSLTSTYSAKVSILVDTSKVAPQISSKLAAQTLKQGDSLVLTIAINANAFPAPLYSWYKAASFLDSTRTNSWKKLNVQGTDSGYYYVIVSNAAGRDSSGAHVVVNVPVSITTQPLIPAAKCQGDSVTLVLAAAGTPPISYQWQLGGTNVTGDTFSTCHFSSLASTNAGVYTCKINNVGGTTVTSNPCTLKVNTPATISAQSATSIIRCMSDTLTLSVTAAGTAPINYQWLQGGANISGATSAAYHVSSLATVNAGIYTCVVSNMCGTPVLTKPCTLAVNAPATITAQPISPSAKCPGDSVTISVVATGSTPISYQWQQGGASVAGDTFATVHFAAISPANAGIYVCKINGACGAVVASRPCTLAVNTPATISAQSATSIIRCQNDSVTFSVTASGTAPLNYQWSFAGGTISGATGTSYHIVSLTSANAGIYTCVVGNMCGTPVTSKPCTLAVNTPPSITTQPVSQSVWASDSAVFTIVASGTTPLSYQWKKNGANIGGATSASFTYKNISYPSDSGLAFTCVVTNGCSSSATSNAAILKIKAIKAVSAGYDYSLILMTDGSLWACGNNTVGQLGIGVSAPSPVPVHVADSVIAVSAGCVTGASSHSLILKSDGSAWACGDDSYGELGDGAGSQQNSFQKITAVTNIRAISAGYYNTLLNKNDNTLWGCGWNQFAQLGNGTTNDMGALGQVASNVQKAYLAGISSLYLKTDGSVWTAGQDDGQFGTGAPSHTDSVPVPIMASKYKSFTGVTDLCGAGDPGSDYYFFLKYDQTVWIDEAGVDSFPRQVVTSPGNPLTGIASISGGDNFRFAVKGDGTLWGWGDNSSGQLGDGTTNSQSNPIQVSDNIQYVSAGNGHTLIVKKDGSLWGCGSNSHGQLGTSTPTIIKSPVQIRF
jgi:alpha-tubulin suppressor-like RCC1 family protein